jgi:hypothetical protein
VAPGHATERIKSNMKSPEITIPNKDGAGNTSEVSPQLKEFLLDPDKLVQTSCLTHFPDGSIVLAHDWEHVEGLPTPIRRMTVFDAGNNKFGDVILSLNAEDPDWVTVGSVRHPDPNDARSFVKGLHSEMSPLFPVLRNATLSMLKEKLVADDAKVMAATEERNHDYELMQDLIVL